MAGENNTKPASWLMIILILIAAAGLLFGFFGTIFNLSANSPTIGSGAVVGALAAFLIVCAAR